MFKNIVFLFLLSMMFSSCVKDKTYRGYYDNGNIEIEVPYDKDSILNGTYKEYYKTGELKVKRKYVNNEPIDTSYVYHKNGITKAKGRLKNHLVNGLWSYYDSLGRLEKKIDFIYLDGKAHPNQTYFYNKKGELLDDLSSYFSIELKDTISLGKSVGDINYNSNLKSAYYKTISVVIDNQYSDGLIKKDTFISYGNLGRFFFGMNTVKTGYQTIKGEMIERAYFRIDSLNSNLKEHRKYFEKKVYVLDTVKKNEAMVENYLAFNNN